MRLEENGEPQELESYRYDSAGQKTRVQLLDSEPPNTGYGIEGSEHAYSAPGAVSMTVAYDGHDQPTEALFHDASHGLVLQVTFTRDSHRRLLEEHAHFGGETPFPSATTLDRASPEDRSKLVALLASAFADHTFLTTTYAYDQDGRFVERVRRMGQLSGCRETFRYDDHGNPVEQISETRAQHMDLDEGGNPRATEEPLRQELNRFEYRYDSEGNWTERVVFLRHTPNGALQRSNIERREFEYYTDTGAGLVR